MRATVALALAIQVAADGKPQPALVRPDLVMAAAKGIFPAKAEA